jgi:hypothetical protein
MIFEARRPGLSWPIGNYVIDFIINDKNYAQHNFEIVSSETSVFTEKGNWINKIETSKTVDSSHNPTNPTSTLHLPTNKSTSPWNSMTKLSKIVR